MAAISEHCTTTELSEGELITSTNGVFRVKELIARGRCCNTFEGENVDPGHSPLFVALKVFRNNQDYRGALKREKMVLHDLAKEKYIVHQYAHVTTSGGRDVLVQELLSGTAADVAASLREAVTRPSTWHLHCFATHVARGLACMHRHGITHGDVKLHNIMWSADDAAYTLIDFGLSTRVGEPYRHRVYSPENAAPEVLTWNRHVEQQQARQTTVQQQQDSNAVPRPGPPADVWAFGCCLAKLASGKPLFCEGTFVRQEDVDEVINDFLKTWSMEDESCSRFSVQLNNFLKSCLRVCPSERATAAVLSTHDWKGNRRCRPWPPTYQELVTLPTRLICLKGIIDINTQHRDDDTAALIVECGRFGPVVSHFLDATSGNLYVLYSCALDAETALQRLKDTDWRDRTLVVVFYPPQYFASVAK